MRIAIQTFGTRGDVQPYVALARGLIERGHRVQLAAPEQFVATIKSHNVDCALLPGELMDLLHTPQGKAAVAGGSGFGAGLKLLKHVRPLMVRLLEEEWRSVERFSPDIIVYHPKSVATPHMAEKLARPSILASPLPGFTPTADFPSPLLPFDSLGPLNRASHSLAMTGAKLLFSRIINQWRDKTLSLPKGRGVAPHATLYAYSAHVVPRPVDWSSDVHVTGYWFLDDTKWSMPPDIAVFIQKGPPPLYIGFGSMPGLDPEATARLFVRALEQTGDRAIIATGGGALCKVPAESSVLFIDGAPHDQIFPHIKAVIHHGGAGTTAAALRAGKPTLMCPFFGDQPFWARRAARLGVGPPPLRRRSLTVGAIANGLKGLTQPQLQKKASEIGQSIRSEAGVSNAIAVIEALQKT